MRPMRRYTVRYCDRALRFGGARAGYFRRTAAGAPHGRSDRALRDGAVVSVAAILGNVCDQHGDELEALGDQFNAMAARRKKS